MRSIVVLKVQLYCKVPLIFYAESVHAVPHDTANGAALAPTVRCTADGDLLSQHASARVVL